MNGFFGGYAPRTDFIRGTTILDEDRSEGVDPHSVEELMAREHSRTCRACRSGREPKCAACGSVTCDIARLKNYCFGCMHIVCPRHAFWPNRKHSPEDHGPSTGSMANPRKRIHREYMRIWREKRRGLAPATISP